MIVGELWSARVQGHRGQFESARLLVDERGRFVWETANVGAGSADRAVIPAGDVERLRDALVAELGPGGVS